MVIPEYIAKILSKPEIVNDRNKEWISELIMRGPSIYPGANYLIMGKDRNRKDLSYGNRRQMVKELEIGDVIERHIIDGDIVLFNRQPSLHRISIMGFRALVKKNHTLRFNECSCTPFNADFDGDEMNIHIP